MNYNNAQTEYLINRLRDYSEQNYPGQTGNDIRVPKDLIRAVANRLESLSQYSDDDYEQITHFFRD